MKNKVYIETSVISYLTARPSRTIVGAAHQQTTKDWWDSRFKYDLYVSELVIEECSKGDQTAARNRLAILENVVEVLPISEQALVMAENLVKNGMMPNKAIDDAIHITIATLNCIDYLLTWNFRHITNPIIQRNIANDFKLLNLSLPIICTPEVLLGAKTYD